MPKKSLSAPIDTRLPLSEIPTDEAVDMRHTNVIIHRRFELSNSSKSSINRKESR
jgi:hypothetical protein